MNRQGWRPLPRRNGEEAVRRKEVLPESRETRLGPRTYLCQTEASGARTCLENSPPDSGGVARKSRGGYSSALSGGYSGPPGDGYLSAKHRGWLSSFRRSDLRSDLYRTIGLQKTEGLRGGAFRCQKGTTRRPTKQVCASPELRVAPADSSINTRRQGRIYFLEPDLGP